RRQPVAHGARAGGELGAETGELVEAVRPDGEVARAAGEDGVLGEPAAEEGQVVGARRGGPLAPARRVDRLQLLQAGGELRHPGDDRKIRLVHAPELVRVGMDVYERLLRPGDLEQRVVAR